MSRATFRNTANGEGKNDFLRQGRQRFLFFSTSGAALQYRPTPRHSIYDDDFVSMIAKFRRPTTRTLPYARMAR